MDQTQLGIRVLQTTWLLVNCTRKAGKDITHLEPRDHSIMTCNVFSIIPMLYIIPKFNRENTHKLVYLLS